MKKEAKNKYKITFKIIHYRRSPSGWAIVLLPNELKVDNYDLDVHIYPEKEIITIREPDLIFNIICNHIMREKIFVKSKLRKELGLDDTTN